MRVLLFALASCAHINEIVPLRSQALSWEEYCIQQEIRCLGESRAGFTVIPIFSPFAIFGSQLSGEQVARSCELQGSLCLLRSREIAHAPASAPVTTDEER